MEFQVFSPEELLGPLNEVETKHAPKRLFVSGDVGVLSKGARVAIVGSRKASDAGLRRAKKLAELLAGRGDVVVSGLASGIDTVAHKAAMAAGGKTIAVLGTPLDKVYPRENAELQRTILREHLAISEFPVGYKTNRGSFPMRNRTMALLSDVTVILEAGDSSGSLSQGWEALRLGRGLFIAKSTTENKALSWPKEMLHYGAEILSDKDLEAFFHFLPPRRRLEEDAAVPF